VAIQGTAVSASASGSSTNTSQLGGVTGAYAVSTSRRLMSFAIRARVLEAAARVPSECGPVPAWPTLNLGEPPTLLIEPAFLHHAASSNRRIAGLARFFILSQATPRP
jgi:hypothetical protein